METRLLFILAFCFYDVHSYFVNPNYVNSYNPGTSYLGPSEYIYQQSGLTMKAIYLSPKSSKMSFNSNGLILPRTAITRLIENTEAAISGRSTRQSSRDLSNWSRASCCRRASGTETGTQTRLRVIGNYLLVQVRSCSSGFCNGCQDALPECPRVRFACVVQREFMSQFCPTTCGLCGSPPTTPKVTSPPQTTAPSISFVRVHMYFRLAAGSSTPIKYKFVRSGTQPGAIWRPNRFLPLPGEIPAILLSTGWTPIYSQAIYFCRIGQGSTELWRVQQTPCGGGYVTGFRLYGAQFSRYGTRILVSQAQNFYSGSRIHTGNLRCCGYTSNTFEFFAPVSAGVTAPPPITRFPTPPPSTNRPRRTTRFTTRAPPLPPVTRQTIRPPTRPTVPTIPSSGSLSPLARECLDYHNFLRFRHNDPPMQYDEQLAITAQNWANHLASCAPEHPDQVRPDCRTSSWPHSMTNRGRPANTGENIAWDFSIDGFTAKQAVLRWYLEIFDYNRANPTVSLTNNPVGHYTQVMWRSSQRLGCGVAEVNIRRGSFTYKSTWLVSHYAPAGNVRSRSPQETINIFNLQVPDTRPGTCRIQCTSDSACLGYDSSFSCTCDNVEAQCKGRSGGCVISCARPRQLFFNGPTYVRECRGQSSCYCTTTPVRNTIGAICE